MKKTINFKALVTTTFFSLSVVLSALGQSGEYKVQGTVDKNYDGQFVKLFSKSAAGERVDSVLISDGGYVFSGSVDEWHTAVVSMAQKESGDRLKIFLSPGDIVLTSSSTLSESEVKGNSLAVEHQILQNAYLDLEYSLIATLDAFKKLPKGSPEAKAYFQTEVDPMLGKYGSHKTKAIYDFIASYPDSYIGLYYLDLTASGRLLNYETHQPHFAKLSAEVRESALGRAFEERLMAQKSRSYGEPYTDFVSNTPTGEQLSLSKVLEDHELVLLDFWASWCGPCRKENPHVVRTFQAFKDQGFTVFSVSLDDDLEKWKGAIEQDGMPWYHVSELKGWKESAATTYNVRAIPQNFLIRKDGTIVAVNLRGETLYERVASLMKAGESSSKEASQ